jgi:hypothetical protein
MSQNLFLKSNLKPRGKINPLGMLLATAVDVVTACHEMWSVNGGREREEEKVGERKFSVNQ